MDHSKIIDKINDQAKGYYSSSIDDTLEDSKTTNWLLGLAGGALLFSFNKVDHIIISESPFIIVQALTFVGIIITGFIYRTAVKNFKKDTASIIRLFDFLRFEFDLVPDELINDLENEHFDQVYSDYVNGRYFIDGGADRFDYLVHKRDRHYSQYRRLSVLAIILMVVQFGCFFLSLLKL